MESGPIRASREMLENMTAAEQMCIFIQSFPDLYQFHPDILWFSHEVSCCLRHEEDTSYIKATHKELVDRLAERFHEIYECRMLDGTLSPDIPEEAMFSSSFHILPAAVTRYDMGFSSEPKEARKPKSELIMLKDMLLAKFTKEAERSQRVWSS